MRSAYRNSSAGSEPLRIAVLTGRTAVDVGIGVALGSLASGRLWLWIVLIIAVPLTIRLWRIGSLLGDYGPYLVNPVLSGGRGRRHVRRFTSAPVDWD
jgi:hypothetical protein